MEFIKEKDPVKKLEKLHHLTFEYIYINIDSAKYYNEIEFRLARLPEYPIHAVNAYYNKGIICEMSGDLRGSLKYRFIGLDLVKKYKIKKREIRFNLYNSIGISYDYLGKYDSSLIYYQIAEGLADNNGSKANLFSNIGLVYYYKGEVRKAIENFEKSLKYAEEAKNEESKATALLNMGMVYASQSNNERALTYYRSALEIYKKTDIPANMSTAYTNIGAILMEKDPREALLYHEKALSYTKKSGNLMETVIAYNNIGSCYHNLQDYKNAEIYFDSAYNGALKVQSPELIMEVCVDRARTSIEKNELDEAEKFLNIALEYLKETPKFINISEIYFELARLHKRRGNIADALKYTEEYYRWRDSLINSENDKKLLQASLEYDYQKKEQEKDFKRKEENLQREKREERQKYTIWFLIIAVAGFIVFAGFLFVNLGRKKKNNLILQSKNEQIIKQSEIIEEKNKDITSSIQYAQRLQNGILPESEYISKLFKEHFIFFQPKDIVSGDFYWFEQKENKIWFSAVDCTGHGVPGGFMSMLGHNALHSALNEYNMERPSDILEKTTELLIENFSKQKEEIRDGMDLSLCCLTKNGETQWLEYSGAHNNLWVVTPRVIPNMEPDYSRNGIHLYEIAADKQPIGLYDYRKPFTNHSLQVITGDSLYLYTDGYADQFGGPNGKKFKYKKLKELILDHYRMNLKEQCKILEKEFVEWSDGFEQTDDVCVIGIKI